MRQLVLLVVIGAVSCAAKPADSRYPPRPENCEVKLFHEEPTMSTDALGAVMARCSEDVSDTACLRQLQDETCKLGGDVVWGVPEKPTLEGNKNVWYGRAAHTKSTTAPR